MAILVGRGLVGPNFPTLTLQDAAEGEIPELIKEITVAQGISILVASVNVVLVFQFVSNVIWTKGKVRFVYTLHPLFLRHFGTHFLDTD